MKIRERLFRGFTGCTNHDCIITGPKTGMGTNGSCGCLKNLSRGQLDILKSRLSGVVDKEIKESQAND